MDKAEFERQFEALTGPAPLSWQWRLFEEHFRTGNLPGVIDLPTGLGKTMIMAIWLIARLVNPCLPRRLVYVVDRRTVVDQATDLAMRLSERCKEALGTEPPAISTLRGQLADNREWSRDLSKPAIIIGTVDLIGSGLLFSGYRSSYKRRPLEAGLLGVDSLLVLDEAHLSTPFEKLLCSIGKFNKPCEADNLPVKPMCVIRMSATSSAEANGAPFRLEGDFESRTGDFADDNVFDRYKAAKRLTIIPLGEKDKLTDRLASKAIELAKNKSLRGKRIVVFVRRPDHAKEIAKVIKEDVIESLDESGGKPKKLKHTPYTDSVEVLTGTMRGLERDELVEMPVLKRFLDGDEDPNLEKNTQPVFLISTSAGEVGFDLNADHLVGDEAPLDSWIQRLGRVNRRGKGEATVILVREYRQSEKTDFDKACIAATKLIADHLDGNEVSPRALAAFKESLRPDEIEMASSPKPTAVELTDILLDAWSMTSITDRMPGRPEVSPWLRGLEEEQAQTTIAWRAEPELFDDDLSSERVLSAIFLKHPIRPHEALTVNTRYLIDEFLKKIHKLKDRPPNLMAKRVAVRLPRGRIVCQTLQQLTDMPGILYADSTLILPAKFGGLDDAGMLDAESIQKVQKVDGRESTSLDVADRDGYERTDEARSRLRIVIERSEDGLWTPKAIPGLSIPANLKFETTYDKSTSLFKALRDANFRVRLVQPIKFDDEGDPICSLVVLAPAPIRRHAEDQLLTEHVGAVEAEARRIADALHLAPNDFMRIALLFAARWHDEGKKARIWQIFANNVDLDGPPLGKMSRARDPKSLRGYRHEFGSLLRIHHPDRCDTTCFDSPSDPEVRELALHLIATHHGAGRPHFEAGVYHQFTDVEWHALHNDSVRRFARLQKKYGRWHLAWLENLLRCADQLASADEEVTGIDELEGVLV